MKPRNSVTRILLASLVGTTIEFFDFYIFANAAVLVFPKLFFPRADPTAGMLESLATFGIAFVARPVGSAIFGHFGDRVGRKATLVAALLTMGIATVAIGLLPTYAMIGAWAPLLLAVCRLGQGLGLGGEWGGAVLLATENAPPGKRAWYGMFPQLGAPIGFILSGGFFLVLSEYLSDEQFFSYGWRVPFLASTALIVFGLYVRLKITETPAFERVLKQNTRVRIPTVTVVTRHLRALVLGVFIALTTFLIFYLSTVFTQSWATMSMGYTRPEFLRIQLFADLFFGATIPVSAILADRLGRLRVLIAVTVAIGLFGFLMAPMFGSGSALLVTIFLCLALALMGMSYGPLGTMLSELFPAEVRFTGASLTFNLAGIFGASLAPFIAVWLAKSYGLAYVGLYLSVAALATLISV
ncbi:MAG: MHS family MFS transporter, partial [Candidatus Hydrogenedentes bacterium]|nr:MHS family MFS transporter [Candidatus Hydrogenedentota bacterium]